MHRLYPYSHVVIVILRNIEKIFAEIQQEDAISLMIEAIAADDYVPMEEIAGYGYGDDREFYDAMMKNELITNSILIA